MNEIEILRQAIEHAFLGAEVTIYEAQGGYLVSVVHRSFSDKDGLKNQNQVLRVMEQAATGVVVLHKLLTYRRSEDSYQTPGTLHTVKSEQGGFGTSSTTTLSENDAYLLLHDIDAEYLLYGDYRVFECRAVELPGEETGRPVLPFQEDAPFVELETQGGFYGVQRAHRDDGRIIVTVGANETH